MRICAHLLSLPARGAWIETVSGSENSPPFPAAHPVGSTNRNYTYKYETEHILMRTPGRLCWVGANGKTLQKSYPVGTPGRYPCYWPIQPAQDTGSTSRRADASSYGTPPFGAWSSTSRPTRIYTVWVSNTRSSYTTSSIRTHWTTGSWLPGQ